MKFHPNWNDLPEDPNNFHEGRLDMNIKINRDKTLAKAAHYTKIVG
jgi:hypothetical protein